MVRRRRSWATRFGVRVLAAAAVVGSLVPARPAAALVSPPVQLGTNQLNVTFAGGSVMTRVTYFDNRVRGVAIQRDGKVIVTGNGAMDFVQQCFEFVRYNLDGTIDTTFGENGIADADPSAHLAWPYDLEQRPDGRILTGGFAEEGVDRVRATAFTQLLPDGTRDPSFGTNGVALFADGTIHALSVLPDGTFLAGGYNVQFGGSSASLIVDKHLANGAPDPTFGSGGRFKLQIGRWFDRVNNLAVQPDGRIVAVGSSMRTDGYEWVVLRLLPDGTLDPSFGSGGSVLLRMGTDPKEYDEAFGVALQADGEIVVVGNAWTNGSTNMVTVRLNPDGTRDTSFGWNGANATDFAGGDDRARNVEVLSGGRILVSGNAWVGDRETMAAIVYDHTGHLDRSFGTGGKVAIAVGEGDAFSRSMALSADGTVATLGGFAIVNGSNRFALVSLRLP